ncbi:MAG: hypothetical protein DMD99_23955 [Candidatus Rokuibacteriota bacterium]|nr:MAG: hypothetical protein DMD99_23955 [Candidatus Rokubacteria bacterium]
MVRLRVDVIVVSSTLTALAARQATTTVSIVMTVPGDPVATGLVTSLARPGGNVTGLSFVGTELAGKQVELRKEAVPGLVRVAVLVNPTNPSHAPRTKEIAEVARAEAPQRCLGGEDAWGDSRGLCNDGEAPFGGRHRVGRSNVRSRGELPRAARRRAAATRHVRAQRGRGGGRPDVLRSELH